MAAVTAGAVAGCGPDVQLDALLQAAAGQLADVELVLHRRGGEGGSRDTRAATAAPMVLRCFMVILPVP